MTVLSNLKIEKKL